MNEISRDLIIALRYYGCDLPEPSSGYQPLDCPDLKIVAWVLHRIGVIIYDNFDDYLKTAVNNMLAADWLLLLARPTDVTIHARETVDAIRTLINKRPQFNMPIGGLSASESEVLHHMAAGITMKEISQRLDISEVTVKTYIQKLRSKLGAPNRMSMIAIAASWNLLDYSKIPWATEIELLMNDIID